eukprot:NODE_290_length_11632_cov_0.441256.p8 type:complete len:110 gc:universal NODE_290_length_11632_cov_0.441256:5551-5222(-)
MSSISSIFFIHLRYLKTSSIVRSSCLAPISNASLFCMSFCNPTIRAPRLLICLFTLLSSLFFLSNLVFIFMPSNSLISFSKCMNDVILLFRAIISDSIRCFSNECASPN